MLLGVAYVLGCGDPVAPVNVTSKAFILEVDVLAKSVSRSADYASRWVGIGFTIRNPLPVRATLREPAPDDATDGKWTVYLRDVEDEDEDMLQETFYHAPISLAPGEVRVFNTAFYISDSMPAGRYHLWGGVLGSWDYVGVFEVRP